MFLNIISLSCLFNLSMTMIIYNNIIEGMFYRHIVLACAKAHRCGGFASLSGQTPTVHHSNLDENKRASRRLVFNKAAKANAAE